MTALAAMQNPKLVEGNPYKRIVVKSEDGTPVNVTVDAVKSAVNRYGAIIRRLHDESRACAPPTRAEHLSSPHLRVELVTLLGFDRYTSQRDIFIDVMKSMFGAK